MAGGFALVKPATGGESVDVEWATRGDVMATGYCGRCGERLEIRTTWNGHATVHYTLVPVASEVGKTVPVTHCPGCGEWLREELHLVRVVRAPSRLSAAEPKVSGSTPSSRASTSKTHPAEVLSPRRTRIGARGSRHPGRSLPSVGLSNSLARQSMQTTSWTLAPSRFASRQRPTTRKPAFV